VLCVRKKNVRLRPPDNSVYVRCGVSGGWDAGIFLLVGRMN